jgi:tetratricopeptide (TPR) repeat protein
MDNIAKKGEPRGTGGQPVESEYSIEHPLIGNQSLILGNAGAMDLFVESVKCLQDGNRLKASTLYHKALKADPSLHTHAHDALSNMTQSCSPETEGAVYYWLGIHSQYLEDNDQAIVWYEKAIEAFHKIGYQKREARAHCNLGTAKMQLEDPSGMEEYEKAVTLNPMDGIAHINIGMAYYITDDYERALDAFADAVWADPSPYVPLVIRRLQSFGYTWKEDLEKIGQRIARKQGMDLDTLTAGEREDILQANRYFEIGSGFFQAGRYKEALEQFEKGKLITQEFPGNFLGVSMTAMQMIELGVIPKDQIPFYLEEAELNIDECLRIAPTHVAYLGAKNAIRDYKTKYHVS